MSEPVYKFEIPNKFICTLGNTKTITVYPDKVMFDDKVIDYHKIDGVRPAKERDGFLIDLSDEGINPFNATKFFDCHFKSSKVFGKKAAKAYGMKVYSAIFSAMSR